MLPRQLQQLERLVRQVDGIVGGDGHIVAAALLEVVIEDFRVLLLLPGGIEENLLQNLQVLFLTDAGGKGVAVPRLALSGKGAEQILLGDAVFQIHCVAPFLMANTSILFRNFPFMQETDV